MFNLKDAASGDELKIALVNFNCWKESYNEFISPQILSDISLEKLNKFWKNCLDTELIKNKSIVLATQFNGEVMGFLYFSLDSGELIALNVQKKFHRLGLGKKLFNFGLETLFNRGHSSVFLWVLDGNYPARNFYAKMGGKYLSTGTRSIASEVYPQTCLVWNKPLPSNNLDSSLSSFQNSYSGS